MKRHYAHKNINVLILISLFPLFVFGQTVEQKKVLLEQYDLTKIKKLQLELVEQSKKEKEKAFSAAKKNQWPIFKKNSDGSFDELVGLFPNGSPRYLSINNVNAANSTRANRLNAGGSLGLNLNGQGMVGGVWDGGPVRTSHQEFDNRVTVGDGAIELNGNSFHATHVTGTVGASGVDFNAKGMAFQATVKTFDWTQDEAEVLAEIQDGLLLSNHSYGVRVTNAPGDWYIGAYTQDALQWDMIHYLSPYYLMVVSAGNDGNATNDSPSTPGFDKLMGNKNAKNNLVIANAQDAEIDQNGNLIAVSINSGSSEGPSDDFRIKPDITGNGTNLYSTNSNGDDGYGSLSGTSMSGPNVMGTLLLLQQHYSNVNQKFLKSATLKGLACHTADDAGNPGPDAIFGWGLLNAKKGAEAITNNGLSNWISEESLTQSQVYTKTVKSIANQPLIATICWTDIPGNANNGNLNDTTPALVHDLDIRITRESTTFYPWRLQSNANLPAIRNGDNVVDNVETIRIENANGNEYTITVSHKGTLQTNNQDFSLIISGIDSDFGIVPLGYDQIKCANETATYSFAFNNTGVENVTLSAIDIPAGAIVNFSSNPLNSSGNFDVVFSNLSGVEPGEYTIGIVAANANESETRYVNLKILSSEFNSISNIFPVNGQTGVASSTHLTWEHEINAEAYTLEVSTDINFSTLVLSETTDNNSVNISDLTGQTVYYWRVKPSNRCGNASEFSVSSFQTAIFNCGIQFVATDFSNSSIDDIANSSASIPIEVSGGINTSDVNVSLDISHTWVQDMSIFLVGPPDLGSPTITLFEEPCGGQNDIDVTLDDSGSLLTCGSNPAISGIIKPNQPLSGLNGLVADGIWTLFVIDQYNNDGGTINSFSLEFCNSTLIENNLIFENNGIITETNSTKLILIEEINALTVSQSDENQQYTVIETPTLGLLEKDGITLNVGDTFTQEDVNLNRMSYSNTLTNEAIDAFKVNIINATSSWLPNVVVPITIQNNLSNPQNSLDKIVVYPNPSRGMLTVSLPSNLSVQTNIELVDLQGRVILSKQINSSTEVLDLNNFSDGIYLISIENENAKILKKIILKK